MARDAARRRVQARRRKWLFSVLVPLAIVGAAWLVLRPAPTQPLTALETRTQAEGCQRKRDLACAEAKWRAYVHLRPDDDQGFILLGIALNEQDKHADALAQFDKVIMMAGGRYDMFAYYADSLAKLGRIDDAIDWSYKALSVAPRLLEVRSQLAKLLVSKGRHYEALSMLKVYDADRESRGQTGYFLAQRIAIESAIGAAQSSGPHIEQQELRLAAVNGHFFVPITIGTAPPTAYMVDTGASRMMLSEQALRAAKADFKAIGPRVMVSMADGRKVPAQAVMIASLRLGRFALENVSAMTCDGCALLLGQSTLSRFDIRSSRSQGVEFLTLTPRF